MDIEKIKTIKVEPSPVQCGVDCLICGNIITLGPAGYNFPYVPKICNECKRGLMLTLYPEREEDKP